MRRPTKFGLAAIAAGIAFAGGFGATQAIGALNSVSVDISALKAGTAVTLDAPSKSIITNLDALSKGFAPHVDQATSIAAAGGETWTVVPTGDGGSCVKYPDTVVGCGSGEEIKSGAFGVEWIDQPENAVKGQTYPATRRGLVPDGVTEVDALGADGSVLHRARVFNNTYVLALGLEGQTQTIKLVGADGKTVASTLLNK